MVDPANSHVSIVRQCRLLSISRSGWYYERKGENPFNLSLMRMIDEQFLATPYYGSQRWSPMIGQYGSKIKL